MAFFRSPTSFRLSNDAPAVPAVLPRRLADAAFGSIQTSMTAGSGSHPALGHLVLLVFEAVMEVVCVSLPGYIVARQGMFDAEKQKFVANLNVALFTPCLIFTKLASQLTADKLVELAVIPVIFVLQIIVSYLVSWAVSRAFGFSKKPANFVTAMAVFGNSNSLPISLVISLSQTLKGLHWDKIPGDNDEEVAARGILYLLIFQQLGQLVRWSWGYHVLLAPQVKYEDEGEYAITEEGRYRDEPIPELIPGLDGDCDGRDDTYNFDCDRRNDMRSWAGTVVSFESDGRTPVNASCLQSDGGKDRDDPSAALLAGSSRGNDSPGGRADGNLISFPKIRSPHPLEGQNIPAGIRGWIPKAKLHVAGFLSVMHDRLLQAAQRASSALPGPLRKMLQTFYQGLTKFLSGIWEFMNPPLWAMLVAVLVASVPKLQHLFFAEGSFIANSVTRAVQQSGGVAVPLILVVLGANLARNTLPNEAHEVDAEEEVIGTKLLVASLISRMLLPTLIMAPMLALIAKYVPVSIVDDPIFVIVCFLLSGAPSALQLAQICQINGVYEGVMSKLLFQSYVIWILPSTLFLVMCALEVVEWANPS